MRKIYIEKIVGASSARMEKAVYKSSRSREKGRSRMVKMSLILVGFRPGRLMHIMPALFSALWAVLSIKHNASIMQALKRFFFWRTL